MMVNDDSKIDYMTKKWYLTLKLGLEKRD